MLLVSVPEKIGSPVLSRLTSTATFIDVTIQQPDRSGIGSQASLVASDKSLAVSADQRKLLARMTTPSFSLQTQKEPEVTRTAGLGWHIHLPTSADVGCAPLAGVNEQQFRDAFCLLNVQELAPKLCTRICSVFIASTSPANFF